MAWIAWNTLAFVSQSIRKTTDLPRQPPHDAQSDVSDAPPAELVVIGVTELLLDDITTEVKRVVGGPGNVNCVEVGSGEGTTGV